MSRSIRKETSSLVFGIVGRFGGSSTGFVVAALNAASAASRDVVVLRVLSAGILCPRARLHFLKRKLGGHTKACDRRRLLFLKSSTVSASPLEVYTRRSGIRLAKIDHSNDHRADRPRILEAAPVRARLYCRVACCPVRCGSAARGRRP